MAIDFEDIELGDVVYFDEISEKFSGWEEGVIYSGVVLFKEEDASMASGRFPAVCVRIGGIGGPFKITEWWISLEEVYLENPKKTRGPKKVRFSEGWV